MNISLPIRKIYQPDVLVCGLGPAGVAAAIAAARNGKKVLGIDKCAYSGGNITAANVIGVCGAVNFLTGRLIVGGITEELLKASAILRDPHDYDARYPLSGIDLRKTVLQPPVNPGEYQTHPNGVSMVYDAEQYKLEADKRLMAAGVEVLYHTFACDVKTKNGHIESVVITNKDGVSLIEPKMVLDCTGDADIAAWSGAPFEILPEIMQVGTLMFVMGGVEYDDYSVVKRKCIEAFHQAVADGVPCRFGCPGVGRLQHGILNFNMTHVKYNQTVAAEWTGAEITARQDVESCIALLRHYVPEFKNAYLLYSGPHIGARESRRIQGEYILTAEDIFRRKTFQDTIALGGNPIDLHNPGAMGSAGIEMEPGHLLKPYEIPYRTLLPRGVDNLLVAGRCHSVDHLAASSTRVALTAGVLGEAAGHAAHLAIEGQCAPAEINTEELRGLILKNGGILTAQASEEK